ncbi:prepilin-type N-terminal cleavage/methylation domain-containing protein [Photobacterium rosenbergii]|uniref:prepilin-type N-terminal cleavage/methylation domain-containing protein n=1 Tax=Photobacterium rosenbergii TaxID=294936 RepID=UPI001C994DA9|nr:prepilin-type N-terminal cleavage/methylation domain-containing protein [Photobacterium rosenbergii]MBY5949078.1 prepilin-type N-terminal cleavage/methylation domain-containing protein [Photobacterium rosenbergii]
MKKQAGFSLVELVIVIIVVGLLAVAALPRFLNVTDEAKKASIEGVAGGFATAVLSARAQWEANGRPTALINNKNVNSVDYDGSTFMLTAEQDDVRVGYPIHYGKDNNASIGGLNNSECKVLFEQLMQNPPQVAVIDDRNILNGKFKYAARKDSSGNNATCTYFQLASAPTNSNGVEQITSAHSFTYTPKSGSVVVNIQ